jgi:hypothetical protein
MKKNVLKKSLQLNRETLHALANPELVNVAGGATTPWASCKTCGSVCATATQLC